jgi:E3 ubiquitin-protein ligase SIAH1
MEEHGSPAVEDTGALDCVLCLLPLKPPIFMFGDGHVVVCAPCRDELVAVAGSKCHACGVAAGGYRRCHAMERVVESARVPCRNIAHGCTARPLNYEVRAHQETCAHGPCRCPFEACGFVGSTAALWDHITAGVHEWSCAKVKVSSSDNDPAEYVDVRLHDGFNIVLGGTGTKRYLFLLNVARYHQPPLTGRAISVLCILAPCSMSMSKEMKCELRYSSYVRRYSKEELVTEHHQKSCFPVACTDLSGGGLPVTTDGCFQFVVPDCVVADNEKDTITVTAQFAIIDRPHFLFGLALNYKWFIIVFSFCGHCV